jgi:hypothetical protein
MVKVVSLCCGSTKIGARSFLAIIAETHRDIFHISGFLLTDAFGQVVQIVLNQAAPLAPALVDPLCALLARTHVAVNLGQT